MEKNHHHIVGYITNLWVWVALIILTIITVAVSEYDLKMLTVVVALTIASIKAGIVLAYFMHLKFDKKILTVFLLIVLVVFLSFIVLTLVDYYYRNSIV